MPESGAAGKPGGLRSALILLPSPPVWRGRTGSGGARALILIAVHSGGRGDGVDTAPRDLIGLPTLSTQWTGVKDSYLLAKPQGHAPAGQDVTPGVWV